MKEEHGILRKIPHNIDTHEYGGYLHSTSGQGKSVTRIPEFKETQT